MVNPVTAKLFTEIGNMRGAGLCGSGETVGIVLGTLR